MKNKILSNWTIKDIAYTSIFLAILIVCSKISFPIGLISMTLQTFAVAIIAYSFKLDKVILILITYIIIGLIGFPVFATGSGISYIFSPSFGFILGFVPFAIILKLFKNIFLSFIPLLILYLIGTVYMYLILTFHLDKDITLLYVLQVAVFPFIIKDIISIVIAKILSLKLNKQLSNIQ